MADEQLEILIKATDEATATLKRIETQVGNTARNSAKANKQLGLSFSSVQGAMLNLGQAAQQIHNIFEISQARTRNLENAQDRLENAQLRVKNAIRGVIDAQKKLNDINDQAKRDGLTLERAKLNQEKATQEAIATIKEFGINSQEAREAIINEKEAFFDLQDAQQLGRKRLEEQKVAQEDLIQSTDSVTIANNNLERSQRALDKTLGDAKWAYVNMGLQAVSAVGSIVVFSKAIFSAGGILGGLSGIFTGIGTAISGFLVAIGPVGWVILGVVAVVTILITVFKKWGAIWEWLVGIWQNILLPALTEIWKWLQFLFLPMIIMVKLAIESLGLAFKWLKEHVLQPFYDFLKKNVFPILEKIWNIIKKVTEGIGSVFKSGYAKAAGARDVARTTAGITRKDFVSRPGQAPINFSPNDTLIGMKNPVGGTTVYITGNIYGTDPDEISEAIMSKLRKKVSI